MSLKILNHGTVYLMGGAVAQNDPRLDSMKHVVSGNVVNVHSSNDRILAYVYRAAELLAQPIGSGELDLDGVLNVDATDIVDGFDGHTNYKKHLGRILAEISFRLGRSTENSFDTMADDSTSSIIETLKQRLSQVPGMTPANHADFQRSTPYLQFRNGVQVNTWKNPVGVDHVFIGNEKKRCVYGGYVGWIHSSGLEVMLEALRRDYAEDLV